MNKIQGNSSNFDAVSLNGRFRENRQNPKKPNNNIDDNDADVDTVPTTRAQFVGKSSIEKMYCFTGTIERVIKWHKAFQNHHCIFEVIGLVVSIRDGLVKLQKIVLLKDQKGPILQVVHYLSNDIHLEDFHIGQKLRCVGNMTGYNILTAISIRSAATDETASLQRHCYIGDYAINRLLSEEANTKDNQLLLK